MSTPWIRVTKANRCPKCGSDSWCCVGTQFINCMRVESQKPCANGGWLHPIGDTTKLRPLPKPEKPVTIDAAAIMRGFTTDGLDTLATALGVAATALGALGCAWAAPHNAWAFPMRSWQGATIGIRLRYPDGQKRAVKGSRNGLFYADGEARTAFVTEGESDTAAALSLGLCAVGRPGCMGGEAECDRLLRRKGARRAVICADTDDAGQRGAEKLQAALSVPSVIFYPPADDLRAAVQAGLTADLIASLTGSMIWHQPKRQA